MLDSMVNLKSNDILNRTYIFSYFPILLSVFPHAAMEGIVSNLWLERIKRSETDWKVFCQEFPKLYPSTHYLLQQDIFTRHSFQRPRGYAGDADLIDIIYDKNCLGSIDLGNSVFSYTIETAPSHSVRERRVLAAGFISEAIRSRPSAKICSIACGHARELDLLLSSKEYKDAPFTFEAHDQDQTSLDRIRHHHKSAKIITRKQSVLGWIKGKSKDQKFDLIYSLGLFDYLEDRVARALVRAAWNSVSPGGKMIFANFTENFVDIAYMEACMNWWLIYRDEEQMKNLLTDVPLYMIENVRLFKDSISKVIYLEVTKGDIGSI